MSGCSASSSPSLVPFAVQTGAKAPGFSPTAPEFTAETDSPLEEAGFELSVPPVKRRPWRGGSAANHRRLARLCLNDPIRLIGPASPFGKAETLS